MRFLFCLLSALMVLGSVSFLFASASEDVKFYRNDGSKVDEINQRLDAIQARLDQVEATLKTEIDKTCEVKLFYVGIGYNRCWSGSVVGAVSIQQFSPTMSPNVLVECYTYKLVCDRRVSNLLEQYVK